MSIGFYLVDAKRKKTSLCAIVRYNKRYYKKGLSISIESRYWNAKRQRATTSKAHIDGAKINFALNEWRRAIEVAITRMGHEEKTPNEFWALVEAERLGTPPPAALSFTEYFEMVFIRRFRFTKTESRVRRFKVILTKLKEFEKTTNHTYQFHEVGISFYRALQQYMYGLNHSPNYFGTTIKVVKQVMKEAAIIDKLHTNSEYLHSDFKAVAQEVDAVYLTLDELHRLHEMPVDERFVREFYPLAAPHASANIKRSYTVVKNRFLIGAFTGLRVSDFNRLTEDNIRGGKIYVLTQKTSEPVVIPIHPVVQQIIDSGFDFSLSLSEDKTRKYIRHLCRYVGIDTPVKVRIVDGGRVSVETKPKYELVSTHTARRSFLTNAYLKGEKPVYLMKISGHKRETTFLSYLKMGREEVADILARGDFFQGK